MFILGSGNGLAAALGTFKDPFAAALQIIKGYYRPMDLWKVDQVLPTYISNYSKREAKHGGPFYKLVGESLQTSTLNPKNTENLENFGTNFFFEISHKI